MITNYITSIILKFLILVLKKKFQNISFVSIKAVDLFYLLSLNVFVIYIPLLYLWEGVILLLFNFQNIIL